MKAAGAQQSIVLEVPDGEVQTFAPASLHFGLPVELILVVVLLRLLGCMKAGVLWPLICRVVS